MCWWNILVLPTRMFFFKHTFAFNRNCWLHCHSAFEHLPIALCTLLESRNEIKFQRYPKLFFLTRITFLKLVFAIFEDIRFRSTYVKWKITVLYCRQVLLCERSSNIKIKLVVKNILSDRIFNISVVKRNSRQNFKMLFKNFTNITRFFTTF